MNIDVHRGANELYDSAEIALLVQRLDPFDGDWRRARTAIFTREADTSAAETIRKLSKGILRG